MAKMAKHEMHPDKKSLLKLKILSLKFKRQIQSKRYILPEWELYFQQKVRALAYQQMNKFN